MSRKKSMKIAAKLREKFFAKIFYIVKTSDNLAFIWYNIPRI